ncbi:MAG: DUF1461 domain-containing protein [Mangrovicoccus sp.]
MMLRWIFALAFASLFAFLAAGLLLTPPWLWVARTIGAWGPGSAADFVEALEIQTAMRSTWPLHQIITHWGQETQLLSFREIFHLRDVSALIQNAARVTGILALVCGCLSALAWRRNSLRSSLFSAGLALLALVAIFAITLSLSSFRPLWRDLHDLVFPPFSYVFSEDTALIRLFPLDFWKACFMAWLVLLGLTGATLIGLTRKRPHRPLCTKG